MSYVRHGGDLESAETTMSRSMTMPFARTIRAPPSNDAPSPPCTWLDRPRRVTVIYVTSRRGHELATGGLRTVCTCEDASISCAFRTLLGFAAAQSANVGKR